MLRPLARLRSDGDSRRSLWVVAWLLLVIAVSPLAGSLAGATDDDRDSELPTATESYRANAAVAEEEGEAKIVALVVYAREGGVTEEDRASVERQRARFVARAPDGLPSGGAARSAPDRSADVLVAVAPLRSQDQRRLTEEVDAIRRLAVESSPPGLRVYVSGGAGIFADFVAVFESLDVKLLLATVLLVLVLLLLIYRSPLLSLLPLVTVGLAYGLASAGVYGLTELGMVISQQATSLLVVFMFGAGTDYCLLILSRYREELRSVADPRRAAWIAARKARPAILASAATVIVALLTLLVTSVRSLHALGPTCAIGVACVAAAALTLFPALLGLVGRRGMWPKRVDLGSAPVESALWRRVARITERRTPILVGVTLLLVTLSMGLFGYRASSDFLESFRERPESVQGFELLTEAQPPGTLAPTRIAYPDATARDRDLERLRAVPGIASSVASGERVATVTLASDPYSRAGERTVRRIRAVSDGLVGGDTATQIDFQTSTISDLGKVVPLTLVAITIILALLLRALVAPLLLLLTTLLSFAATLGLGIVVFGWTLPTNAVDPSLLVYAFVFLVALGIDYNIFLVDRMRQEYEADETEDEDERHGRAVTRALVETGGVITSAGVILAGTFAVLMTLPITFLFQIGFLVGAGILLDTFVVRTTLVPALARAVGRHWWRPSRRSK